MNEYWLDVAYQEADTIFEWCEERFGKYRWSPELQEWRFYSDNK